jgi:pyruvate,orthophosphate dikinase
MAKKNVYSLRNVKHTPADRKELLGGKGANLGDVVVENPVPAGFTITTEMCTEYTGQVELLHLRQKGSGTNC